LKLLIPLKLASLAVNVPTQTQIVETASPLSGVASRASWYVIRGALRGVLALFSHRTTGIKKREGRRNLGDRDSCTFAGRTGGNNMTDTPPSPLRQLRPQVHSSIDTTKRRGGPPLRGMNLLVADGEIDAQMWDRFVEEHSASTHYHRWGWKQVVEESFGWPAFFLIAKEEDTVQGIFPIVWQKSHMFGSFLTSLPFVNGGGVLAKTPAARDALLAEGIALARRLGVSYLELRHRADPQLDLPTKMHKVAMVLPVDRDSEKMWSSLPHKVRTDIRRGIKSDLVEEFGSLELLDDFYTVFARNMRDLGTPVYGRTFFSRILKVFPQDTHICVVRHHRTAVAVSFLMGHRGTIEAGWSASLYQYSSMKPSMFLYWKILCFAGSHGFETFDFGRSSIGSGTYRFKKQWGASEIPLFWSYWIPEGTSLPELNKENSRYRLAIKLWQKLPVQLTKLVGPPIVKRLP
jgi:serine/alanine adding enzyme